MSRQLYPNPSSANRLASGASARVAEFAAELAGALAATCVVIKCVIEKSDAAEVEAARTCIKEFGEFGELGEFIEFKEFGSRMI
ncbi:MAG: hypothetical protein H7Y30_16605 [Pyrinomonadaceae bacterium]|nr:hypothetical protein [Pyrinomonadaceae bacterium]